MIASLSKAAGQLTDPRFRRVLALGLGASVLLYLLLYAAVGFSIAEFRVFHAGWANALLDALGGLSIIVLTAMMFPSVAVLVLSFLLDDIAEAVEEKHYPGLPAPRRQRFREIAWGSLRFTLTTVVLNLLAFPIYLALMIAGLGIGLYYIVNGYLLAREYFELVAWRRLDPGRADALRRAHAGRLWLLGLVLAFLSTLPVISLLAPILGVAAMVHELEEFRRSAGLDAAP